MANRRRVRSRGREPDVGVAHGVRRRVGWVGAARGRRRAGRPPEGRRRFRGRGVVRLRGGLRDGSPRRVLGGAVVAGALHISVLSDLLRALVVLLRRRSALLKFVPSNWFAAV